MPDVLVLSTSYWTSDYNEIKGYALIEKYSNDRKRERSLRIHRDYTFFVVFDK